MRKIIDFNEGWKFKKAAEATFAPVTLPHTWNAKDGQDGGDDYYRDECQYIKRFKLEEFDPETQDAFMDFGAINDHAKIYLNGELLGEHKGGYSRQRYLLNPFFKLGKENEIMVRVTNRPDNSLYPQSADFTFYGGIYREVGLIIVPKNHFDLAFWGSKGLKCVPLVDGEKGTILIQAFPVKQDAEVKVALLDHEGKVVAEGNNGETLEIENVHLWNGLEDPYLYTARAQIIENGAPVDEVSDRVGFRYFKADPKLGFFLNGRPYPLRGVSRHQDRAGKGNAISHEDHEQDVNLILECGANTIRLAHYQHNDSFYDLCDEKGLVVWSEIPYISKHRNEADDNALQQMKELVYQTYNHPCIVFRGLSNEITMKKCDKKDRLTTHKTLNAFVKKEDPHRLSITAGFVMIGDNNPLNFVGDTFAFNFYFGWYAPFTWLNSVRFWWFHLLHGKTAFGLSEYGAEAMTNLHSEHPRRMDNSEEYAGIYHEKLLKIIEKRPYLLCTYVWNMFDFGADGRNQGGDPGKNHKGLVTFDRKIKKDPFYIYQAYWTKAPMLHLCGSRYVNRVKGKTLVKAYTNLPEVEFFLDGKSLGKVAVKDHVAKIKVTFQKDIDVSVKAEGLEESIHIHAVKKKDPSYENHSGSSYSWEKKKAVDAGREVRIDEESK